MFLIETLSSSPLAVFQGKSSVSRWASSPLPVTMQGLVIGALSARLKHKVTGWTFQEYLVAKRLIVLQTAFSNAFCWIKSLIYCFEFRTFVPEAPISNKSALDQVMAWCWTGNKQLPRHKWWPNSHVCVTRPQCVNPEIAGHTSTLTLWDQTWAWQWGSWQWGSFYWGVVATFNHVGGSLSF